MRLSSALPAPPCCRCAECHADPCLKAAEGSGNNRTVYADWTVAAPTVGNGVPAPGSLALLGLGVAGLHLGQGQQLALPSPKRRVQFLQGGHAWAQLVASQRIQRRGGGV